MQQLNRVGDNRAKSYSALYLHMTTHDRFRNVYAYEFVYARGISHQTETMAPQ